MTRCTICGKSIPNPIKCYSDKRFNIAFEDYFYACIPCFDNWTKGNDDALFESIRQKILGVKR